MQRSNELNFSTISSQNIPPPYASFDLSDSSLPLAGPIFSNIAEALGGNYGENLWRLYFRALYESGTFCLNIPVKNKTEFVNVIPGRFLGSKIVGPFDRGDRPRLMIIGKMPGYEELSAGYSFVGPVSRFFEELLFECGLSKEKIKDIYVTNAVKWISRLNKSERIPISWIKECSILLALEIRIVKPDYILCLGNDAVRALFGNKKTVNSLQYKLEPFTFNVFDDETTKSHTCLISAIKHPAAVLREPSLREEEIIVLKYFINTINTNNKSNFLSDIYLRYITSISDLQRYVDFVLSQNGIKKVAVDLEWEGRFPTEPGAFVRSIQLSHRARFGAAIRLYDTEGRPAFFPNIRDAIFEIKRLLLNDNVQICGAHFASDIPWLESLGISVLRKYTVPKNYEDLNYGNYAGGFDVAIAEHAHNETGDFDLEKMALRRCRAEPWSDELLAWKREREAELKARGETLNGYGACPDEILLKYGAIDVAMTRELVDVETQLLNSDRFGNNCWRAFYTAMRATPAFAEIHLAGLGISFEKIDQLVDVYSELYDQLCNELREQIKWPNFNPKSSIQTVELLFGEQYTGKVDSEGKPIRLRPEGAISLYLNPVKTTQNLDWDRVLSNLESDEHTPSTDREVCGILAGKNRVVAKLCDVRTVGTILTTVLRRPEKDEYGKIIIDCNGRRRYNGGLASFVCSDGRIHSTFTQLKESGRASSARPPLQNISNRRENAYKQIAKERYPGPLRSIFCSSSLIGRPWNNEKIETILFEVDFQGAELLVEAVLAGDKLMYEHCCRAALPEDHPDYYDIHSAIAVAAFRLDCPPTKSGLEQIGRKDLRICAKSVIFGGNYGRSPEAIARQCQELQCYDITSDDVKTVMDSIYSLYSKIPILQQALRDRVSNPGWIGTYYKRYRRFPKTNDPQILASMQREALNFPAQSIVADSVNVALDNIFNHPEYEKLGYKIVLQLHDAVMFEVPVKNFQRFMEVVHECFHDKVFFKQCDLDGNVIAPEEYRFGLDCKVYRSWGIPLTEEERAEFGIPENL